MNAIAPEVEDVWRVTGPELRMPGGVYIPLAATVIRLPDRSLLVYSPIDFTVDQVAAIDAAGEVAHVVAPNLIHHLFVKPALAHWPRATLHAPAALATKRDDLASLRPLGDADPAWQGALDVESIGGAPKLAETVLFHRATGTLACADLVFHIARPANLRSRLLFALTGVGGGRLAQSRMWSFAVKDRSAARTSIDRILRWPIARLAPSHGDPVALTSLELAARMTRIYRGHPALTAGERR